jgi:hypothetical protein
MRTAVWTSHARHGAARARLTLRVMAAAIAVALPHASVEAQDVGDSARLVGAGPVAVRVAVEWDEQITNTAGGATQEQYHEAVLQTFRQALEGTDVPLAEDAESFVLCRVQTYYDRGLIAYAVRVEYQEPLGPNGAPVVSWQRGWVGTTAVGGLHQMFALGEQCATDFAREWRAANP